MRDYEFKVSGAIEDPQFDREHYSRNLILFTATIYKADGLQEPSCRHLHWMYSCNDINFHLHFFFLWVLLSRKQGQALLEQVKWPRLYSPFQLLFLRLIRLPKPTKCLLSSCRSFPQPRTPNPFYQNSCCGLIVLWRLTKSRLKMLVVRDSYL